MKAKNKFLGEYEILETLFQGEKSLVYRGVKRGESESVILKTPSRERPSSEEAAALRRQFSVLKNLSVPQVIKARGFEQSGEFPFIVFEDCRGTALDKLYDGRSMELKAFLRIAVQLADILGKLHHQGLVHNNIHPGNLLWNSEAGKVWLIDFCASFRLGSYKPGVGSAKPLERTLTHISPESTGRTEVSVDHRSDFYSLGVTFYQLAAGKLPFEGDDPMELIHRHMAQQPMTPRKINPLIPEVVSEIILRLMAKTVEKRYQGSRGLKKDLYKCLERLETKGRVDYFTPGREDAAQSLRPSRKLYDRDKELDILTDAFNLVDAGGKEIVMVSGDSGVGKTSLINEFKKTIAHKPGYFITGKSDQLRSNIPYGVAIQALTQCVRRILIEPPDQLDYWKKVMLKALYPNAQIIIEMVPDMELVIGPQPPVIPLGPAETRNRHTRTVQNFMGVFSRPGRPLVMFLDDLQWADSSSLYTIRWIMLNDALNSVLLIGAYRHKEVGGDHHLLSNLREIGKQKNIHHFFLKPLDLETINRILAAKLRDKRKHTYPLAELVYQKTGGNPFYLNEFLEILTKNSWLNFDSPSGKWIWKTDKIKSLNISRNLVNLMLAKLERIPSDSLETLSQAACVGNRFDLEILSAVLDIPSEQVSRRLWPAVKEGVIVPEDIQRSAIDEYSRPESGKSESAVYRFHHDKLQEAAYSLFSEEKRDLIHYLIGKWLLDNPVSAQTEKRDFAIVDQLNLALEQVKKTGENLELARLNLEVGGKAKLKAGYSQALKYLLIATELLPEKSWESDYKLTFDIYRECAECAYLSGELELAEKQTEKLIDRARSNLEKAEIRNMQSLQHTIKGKFAEAVQAGIQGLSLLGVKLPLKAQPLFIIKELLLIKWRLRNKDIKELIDQPVIADPAIKLAMRTLINISIPNYHLTDKNLFVLTALKLVNLSLRYGNSPESALAYAGIGGILSAGLGELFPPSLKAGYEFGKLALSLNEKFNDIEHKSKTLYICAIFIYSWNRRWKTVPSYWEKAIKAGYHSGDTMFTANAYTHIILWDPSLDLKTAFEKGKSYLEYIKNCRFHDMWKEARILQQTRKNFLGLVKDELSLSDHTFDEEEFLESMKLSGFYSGVAVYHLAKLRISFFYEDYRAALFHIQEADKLLLSMAGSPYAVEFCVYTFIALGALFPEASLGEKIRFRKRMKKELKRMKRWSDYYPDNFLHFFLLMEAEKARIAGEYQEASILYDQAVTAAQDNGFLFYEALANELAAKFHLSQDLSKIAAIYLKEARDCYKRWGAAAKVRHLEKNYPQLLPTEDIERREKTLDLRSIIKASQAISDETALDRLLEKSMSIMMENAGAERGFILFEKEDKLQIKAGADLKLGREVVLETVFMKDGPELARTVTRYVWRTRETVLLADAGREERFAADPYIIRRRPKSILCFPLLYQDKLTCLVYLENNLMPNAFTSGHLRVLKILSSQAAISLEKADFYAQLENSLAQEKKARQAQEKIDRLKDEFLANTSHELRTPLHGIVGLAESLLARESGSPAPKTRSDLQIIVSNGKRLSHLINDLLDYSSLKYSEIVLKKQPLSLAEAVVTAAALNRPLMDAKKLKFNNRIPSDFPAVEADWDRLQQILHNLIGNAVKFTDEGEITIAAIAKENRAEVEIVDTGIGIAPDKLGDIFDSFSQEKGSAEREYGGVGLGLSITKNLVELHNGEIGAESNPGEGSRFFFTLSLSDQPAIALKSPGPPSPLSADNLLNEAPKAADKELGVIMAVDDDLANLKVVESYLAEEPYKVASVLSGEEALNLIREKGKPRLMLLDIMMPKMDGFKVCRKIRETYSSSELPIIFLTAKNQIGDLIEGFSTGGDDYLTKPFSRDELLSRISVQLRLAQVRERFGAPREPSDGDARSLEMDNLLESSLQAADRFKDEFLARADIQLELTQAEKRFAALRELSGQISRFKDLGGLLKAALEIMAQDRFIAKAAVFYCGKPIHSHPESSEELESHYQKPTSKEAVSISSDKERNFIFAGFDPKSEYVIGLQTSRPVSGMDIEYLKNIREQARVVRGSLSDVMLNPTLISALNLLVSQIDHILFVKVEDKYCIIRWKSEPKSRELLRVSLNNIKRYINDDTLLRIHRSILVNPKHVKGLKKKKSGYEALVGSHSLPVGNSYLKRAREFFD